MNNTDPKKTAQVRYCTFFILLGITVLGSIVCLVGHLSEYFVTALNVGIATLTCAELLRSHHTDWCTYQENARKSGRKLLKFKSICTGALFYGSAPILMLVVWIVLTCLGENGVRPTGLSDLIASLQSQFSQEQPRAIRWQEMFSLLSIMLTLIGICSPEWYKWKTPRRNPQHCGRLNHKKKSKKR